MSINKLSNDLVEATKKVLTKEEEYKDFFQKVMKKFGVKSPGELSGDKEKEFYNYIDKNWKGKKEDIDKMHFVDIFFFTFPILVNVIVEFFFFVT